MIEHLRKYTGLIIIVVALLFVGLAFLGDNANLGQGNANDPPVLSVDGTSYTYSELQKWGKSARSMAMGLGLNDLQLATDAGYAPPDDAQANQRFFVNRLLLKKAREEFGVHPSAAEIAESLKTMPAFQGTDGTFDQEAYNGVVKNIGRLGMTEADMIELIGDNLAAAKISAIIGGGLSADPKIAAEKTARDDQQVSIQLARVPLSKFEESIQPTDEELTAEWETTRDKYQTERRVKVSYTLAKPKYPEPKTEAPKLPDAVTEEARKAAEKEAADKKAAEEAKLAEEKRNADSELADVVDFFLQQLEESEGADFEKLATANQWEFTTTEMFGRQEVPPGLAGDLRSATNRRPIADQVFNLKLGTEPMSRFTDALPVADGGFLIVRLDDEEPVRTKTFEEAKEEVRKDFLTRAAAEALKKDAEEKAAKIREGLAAGKAFADIAKELGLEPKAHGPFKATDKLDGEADTSILFQTAALVDPGSLADPVIRPDGALFVFVENRELVKDPARAGRVENSLRYLAQSNERFAFLAWMKERLENTIVEEISAR
jgi:peptidyl-prolyl cis-trans isomerase D